MSIKYLGGINPPIVLHEKDDDKNHHVPLGTFLRGFGLPVAAPLLWKENQPWHLFLCKHG